MKWQGDRVSVPCRPLFFLLVIFFCSLFFSVEVDSLPKPTLVKLTLKKESFELEVAKTPLSREKGLMYRNHLPTHSGMLFVFDEDSFHPFWMKNTPLSLDIVWLNSQYKIVDFVSSTVPQSLKIYYPKSLARYVIELYSGTVSRLGLHEGDYMRVRDL